MTIPVTFLAGPPRVRVAAVSEPRPDAFTRHLDDLGETWNTDGSAHTPEALVEFAGRGDYRSFRNPGSKTRAQYIEHLVSMGHGSVLEMVTFNVLVHGITRDCHAEIIRHRAGMGYSWESSRFTDRGLSFVIPPRMRKSQTAMTIYQAHCLQSVEIYERMLALCDHPADSGTLRKKRRTEAARAVLPGSRAINGMISLNARAARHFIQMRSAEGAALDIREMAYQLYLALRDETPLLFADAVETDAEWVPVVSFEHPKV